jgi:hypothetical protein
LSELPAQKSEPPAQKSERLVRIRSAIAIMLLLSFGGLVGFCARPSPVAPPAVVEIVRPTPDVITAIRDLSRLETVDYHVERVVDLRDRQQVLFGMLQAEDAILLVAAGDVVAGVDLAKLRPEDVVVDPEQSTATIVLPPAEILSSRLDNDRTFVYTRETDIMARRSNHLETRARQEAERTLREAAVQAGVLARSETNAKRAVESLIRALGYRTVNVRMRTEE